MESVWHIAEILEEHPPRKAVAVILTHQLLPEHAELVSRTDLVVFLDCSSVTTPGVISTIVLQPAASLPRIFTHHLDPSELLKLAQELYGRCPARAVAVTVGGEAFELSEELSQSVIAAIPKALETVTRELNGAD
jgi:hydrogenase maturation protease